jgi:hypothetical protein
MAHATQVARANERARVRARQKTARSPGSPAYLRLRYNRGQAAHVTKLLYKKLAGLWQSQGDGRDGSTEGLQAQWMADASTSLQRGQFCLIQRLIAGVARCDPQLGVSPHNWQPQMPEDVSAYMVHTRAAH